MPLVLEQQRAEDAEGAGFHQRRHRGAHERLEALACREIEGRRRERCRLPKRSHYHLALGWITPVDRRLGDSGVGRHRLDREAAVPHLDELPEGGCQDALADLDVARPPPGRAGQRYSG